MSDTKDAVLQGAPWRVANLEGAVVFSGEGGKRVPRLKDSKKGLPRTLNCARGVGPGRTQWARSLHCRPTAGHTEATRAWRGACSAALPRMRPFGPPGRLHGPCGAPSI